MLRTVKYLSLLVVQFIGALLGVGALFIAFYAVSTPLSEFESAGWRILGMAFACGMMFPFVLQASLIQSYMPLPLSMGVTRRGFFAGAQAAKVMLAGGIGVCLLLIQLAVKWMFGVDALFTGTMLVGLFAVLLLGASVGEALGFVSLRFGRVGMIGSSATRVRRELWTACWTRCCAFFPMRGRWAAAPSFWPCCWAGWIGSCAAAYR